VNRVLLRSIEPTIVRGTGGSYEAAGAVAGLSVVAGMAIVVTFWRAKMPIPAIVAAIGTMVLAPRVALALTRGDDSDTTAEATKEKLASNTLDFVNAKLIEDVGPGVVKASLHTDVDVLQAYPCGVVLGQFSAIDKRWTITEVLEEGGCYMVNIEKGQTFAVK
jgi:hypothetical protein